MTPNQVHYGQTDEIYAERQHTLDKPSSPTRPLCQKIHRAPKKPNAAWINPPQIKPRNPSLNYQARCLIVVDTFRWCFAATSAIWRPDRFISRRATLQSARSTRVLAFSSVPATPTISTSTCCQGCFELHRNERLIFHNNDPLVFQTHPLLRLFRSNHLDDPGLCLYSMANDRKAAR